MPWTNEHLQWLQLIDTKKTADGKDIEIYELNYDLGNDEIFSKWAKHFRNHYCLDSKIERLIRGTNQTKAEYLSNIKFPESNANGAKTRAGDFGEILVSDFLEYILNFWVPRTRFSERQNRNNPTQGVDVIGFKSDDYTLNNRNDELIIFEVKCKLTGINKSNKVWIASSYNNYEIENCIITDKSLTTKNSRPDKLVQMNIKAKLDKKILL